MPLMPADVHNVAFSKPPIGKRGYHEDEVDAFLERVEAELVRLIEQNNDLRDRVEQLEQQQRAAPVDTGVNLHPLQPPRLVMAAPPRMRKQTSPGDDHNVHVAKVLGLAQEMADRLTGEAKTEADEMVSQARTTCEQLLCKARPKADGMVNEARIRAETMLNDARTRAETLDQRSRDKAALLEREAARKHTEIIAALSEEKSTLEKKIDDLRMFEQRYRTHLKSYLESQLRELDGRSSAPPADTVHAQQDLAAAGLGAPSVAEPARVPG
ncbi:MAG: DivIVA domain-containing protein [Actinomycetota bacterium]|nr:DivIVA domain-containing protein [Actinomycetota bacterium]